jgi:hypothetical protein
MKTSAFGYQRSTTFRTRIPGPPGTYWFHGNQLFRVWTFLFSDIFLTGNVGKNRKITQYLSQSIYTTGIPLFTKQNRVRAPGMF